MKLPRGFNCFLTMLFVLALQLTFQAVDSITKELDTQLGIHIKILDANDNAPRFEPGKYETTIKESTRQGSFPNASSKLLL